ncbi:MAG: dihydropteroate synthase [Casimicrobiaceae bacterium]|nr:dihydropteroate synthase [Casimicrobiaceae bacterium]
MPSAPPWTAGLGRPRPLIMGIVNVTPDSFSDGGQYLDRERAIAHGERLAAEGADILDVGGESTRPGATPPSEAEELRRVIPVVEALAARGYCVSIDTRRPAVMAAALAAGASIINDVAALRAEGALELAARHDCGIVLMHMQGTPETMQADPRYPEGVVETTRRFLAERLAACLAAGIAAERIVLDPGIGFGKTATHNAELTRGLSQLASLGRPLLVGWSRKRSLDAYTGLTRKPQERLAESLAAALASLLGGAHIVRVHDVLATAAAVRTWHALAPPVLPSGEP